MNPSEVRVTPTPNGRIYSVRVDCGGVPASPDHVAQPGDHLPTEVVRAFRSGKPLRRPNRNRPIDSGRDGE